MKKLAFGALLVGLFAACGGGSDGKKVSVADGMIDDIGQCNPLTQAGCAAGEKCTWIMDALMPQYVGHIGCAVDGTAAAGDTCMFGAAGATGFDNCAKGTVCGNYRGGAGVCKQICDQQGGMPTCDSTHVCVTYSGLFSNDDSMPTVAGVCDLACNPITDNDFDGSGTASTKTTSTCGSNANVGCYGYPSFGTAPATGWSCTSDINAMNAQPLGLRHRVQCANSNMCLSPGGNPYVNSCNQGYLPLLRESSTVSTAICTALCKPLNCYSGNCGGNGNANRIGEAGNSCKGTDRLGSFTADQTVGGVATGGEHCRYIWSFELDDQGNYLPSATSNTIGFCFDHSKYLYDSDGDNMADKGLPNCGLLADGAGSGSDPTMPLTYFGAADLGCVDTTHAGLAQGKQLPAKIKLDMPRALYHRTMGAR